MCGALGFVESACPDQGNDGVLSQVQFVFLTISDYNHGNCAGPSPKRVKLAVRPLRLVERGATERCAEFALTSPPGIGCAGGSSTAH